MALAAACADRAPTDPARVTAAPHAITGVAPQLVWLTPLGPGTADTATFDATAAPVVEVCAWTGATCAAGTPVTRFSTAPGAGDLPLTADSALGRYEGVWDLRDPRFTTRRTYRVRVLRAGEELGALSVDVVRGRWAPARADGTLAPLQAASVLPIRFHLARGVGIQLDSTAAVPFGVVTVTGLPADYAATPVRIRVGGLPSILRRARGGGSWRFVVPGTAPAGAALVELPAAGAAPAVRATLTIRPPAYVGDSPDSTVRYVTARLATADARLGQLAQRLSPTRDSTLVDRLSRLRAVLRGASALVSAGTARDRAVAAAFYGAHRAEFDGVFDMLEGAVAAVPAGAGSGSGAAQRSQAGVSATAAGDLGDPVAVCDRITALIAFYTENGELIDDIGTTLQILALFPIPGVQQVAAIGSAVAGALSLAGDVLNNVPVLLDRDGLVLQFAPARLGAGASGTMTASVGRHAADAGVGGVFDALDRLIERFRPARAAVRAGLPALREVLDEIGKSTFFDVAEQLLDDLWKEELDAALRNTVALPVDQIRYVSHAPTFATAGAQLWTWTTPNAGTGRSFATRLGVGARDAAARQAAQVSGSRGECLAWTARPDPPNGRQGFVVAGETPDPVAGNTGHSFGDPHLRTVDGRDYSFQAAGDYRFSKSAGAGDDFEVQTRFRPIGPAVSVNDGVAARVAGDLVNIYPARAGFDVFINDSTFPATNTLARQLPGGGAIRVIPGRATVSWPDRTLLTVYTGGGASLLLAPGRRGKIEGLLGDYDGNPANDLRVRHDGPADTTSAGLYGPFRQSWYVPFGAPASLFRRPHDIPDPASFPRDILTLADLNQAAVSAARTTCRSAGVRGAAVLDACAYDVVVTGDRRWAAEAVQFDPAVPRLTVTPALSYAAPDERQTFAAAASGLTNRAVRWTATGGTVAAAGPNSMTYTAPSAPGEYTVTATSAQDGAVVASARVVVRAPNRAPGAAIVAPAEGAVVRAGETVTFAGSATDPEDGALSGAALVWTSDRAGRLGTGPRVSVSTLARGAHVVTLTATDRQGAQGTASVRLTVSTTAPKPPAVVIYNPTDGQVVGRGQAVLVGAATDADGQPLAGAALVWTSDRDGRLGTGAQVARPDLSLGPHTITLRATDQSGATAAASVRIVVRPSLLVGGFPLVPLGEAATVPLYLGEPAPAGGLALTLASRAPAVLAVRTPSVRVPAGAQTFNVRLFGAAAGEATLDVRAEGYVAALVPAYVYTTKLNIVDTLATVTAGRTSAITIRLERRGTPVPAPAGGVRIVLASSDSTCVAVGASATVAAGRVSATAPLSYGGRAALPCKAAVSAVAADDFLTYFFDGVAVEVVPR